MTDNTPLQPDMLHTSMHTELEKWLQEYVPASVDAGIKAVRNRISEWLYYTTVGPTSEVKVWRDVDAPELIRFEYVYLEDATPKLGHYYLDTRFWEVAKEGAV